MNLGLGNRKELKEQVLPAGLVSGTTYDVLVDAIGLGVAKLFDKHCNRRFERIAGATEIVPAEHALWVLSRYPVETVTAVDQKDDTAAGWVAKVVNDVILNRDDEKGLIYFGAPQAGVPWSLLRITYTGGYWFDTTEDGSGVLPGGATKLPEDVKLGWFLQCKEVWNKRDALGVNLVEGEQADAGKLLMNLKLLPQVMELLRGQVRYQMT